MWDDQAAALKGSFRILRYDQRGHGGTRSARGQVQLRPAGRRRDRRCSMRSSIKRAHFCRPLDGRHDGAVPGPAPSRPLRPHHRRAIAGPPPPRPRRSNGRSASSSPPRRAWRRWSTSPSTRWFPPDFVASQGAGARQGPRHDPHHAGQGLRRLRLCAVGLRPAAGAFRHQEPDPAASSAPRTPPSPGIKAIHAAVPGSKLVEARRRRPHLQTWNSRRHLPGALRDFLKG